MSGSGFHGLESLFYLTLFLWTRRMDGLADFSNYLSRIITSHSALACDGQSLRLRCPRHSSISLQSAFYGRGDARLCATDPETRTDNRHCSALTALQKLLSECQSHRDCQLSVNHLLFGKDPCPGTHKYLQVDYKCKPTEHKSLVGCEGESLVLRCRGPKVLNIYAAVYGRALSQTHTCPSPHPTRPPPPFECLNHDAVHTVSQVCYSKQRCVIAVGNQTFRDPCSPGTRKYLHVLYACVPQTLLREADPHTPRPPSTPTLDVGKVLPADVERPFPKGSRLPETSGAMMSSSLMTYAYIREHPETAALLFTSSVCVGLLLTLLAVSLRVTCRGRRPRHHRPSTESTAGKVQIHKCKKEEENGEDGGEDDDDDDEEDETDSSLISATDRKLGCDWEEVTYMTEAAERVERIERREMVIQEIWMNAYMNGRSPGLD